ncbi:MAG: alpha/beta hydrolase [Candidatus Acidiferrales bacterium]
MKAFSPIRNLPFVVVSLSVFACAGVHSTRAEVKDKKPAAVKSAFITTPDGVKIHYLEAGRSANVESAQVGNPLPADVKPTKGNIAVTGAHNFPSLLFVPGWTMPAWIWENQISYFSKDYRVVAMDPRSQGESSQTSDGLFPAARARDIKAVVTQLHLAPVIIVAWSMAVVETMSYVDQFGTGDFAGLVFVDNDAGGRGKGDADQDFGILKGVLEDRQNATNGFVRNLNFKKPQAEEYLKRVIQASLRVPTNTAVALLVGYFVSDYRSVLPKIDKPSVVCAAKSDYMNTIVEMQKQIQGSQLEVFEGAGHALFVDDADQFNSMLEEFLLDLR